MPQGFQLPGGIELISGSRVPLSRLRPLMFRTQPAEFTLQRFKLFIAEVFQIHQMRASSFNALDELIEFQVDCFCIAVLGVLDEEYRQVSENRRSGIHQQLPGVGILEEWSTRQPD